MKCLLVEDDKYKAKNIEDVLNKNFDIEIVRKMSFKTALIESLNPRYDLILLDMSMLTFDITSDEKGGRPRHYAGKEIILKMQYRNIDTPVIVITQFENFGEGNSRMNLKDLTKQLENINYKGYQETIFYNMVGSDWQEKLLSRIKLIMDKRGIK
jgi:DNA-binding NarL/FixJ family response regulator